MRYDEIVRANDWNHYAGDEAICAVIPFNPAPDEFQKAFACSAKTGARYTGRTRVFQGYFVFILGPEGNDWLATDAHSMRSALRKLHHLIVESGWKLPAIGLSSRWEETGLSVNSGFGYHPYFDRPVHMLEPDPDAKIE